MRGSGDGVTLLLGAGLVGKVPISQKRVEMTGVVREYNKQQSKERGEGGT